jgi:hypothetical protein
MGLFELIVATHNLPFEIEKLTCKNRAGSFDIPV